MRQTDRQTDSLPGRWREGCLAERSPSTVYVCFRRCTSLKSCQQTLADRAYQATSPPPIYTHTNDHTRTLLVVVVVTQSYSLVPQHATDCQRSLLLNDVYTAASVERRGSSPGAGELVQRLLVASRVEDVHALWVHRREHQTEDSSRSDAVLDRCHSVYCTPPAAAAAARRHSNALHHHHLNWLTTRKPRVTDCSQWRTIHVHLTETGGR